MSPFTLVRSGVLLFRQCVPNNQVFSTYTLWRSLNVVHFVCASCYTFCTSLYILECLLPSPFPTYYDLFIIVQAVGTPLSTNLGSAQGTAFPFCIQPHSAQETSSPPALVPALDPPTPSGRRIKKVTNTVDRIIEVVKLNAIIITSPVIGTILRTGLNSITTLQVWFENIAALSHPIRSKTKTNRQRCAHGLPRFASASLHVITSSFDWLTALLVSFLIGYSDSILN